MVSINRAWWEHLAPKPMHRRFREVETSLRQWCRSEYGAHWLRIARQEHGVIRVKPGQFIPIVHFIALGDRPVFIAPQHKVRPGHRMVGSDQFRSRHTLEEGELALGPEIRLDVVEDHALLAAAARGDISTHIAGVKNPSLVFSVPARLLLAPEAFPKKSFVLYQHIFGEGPSYPDDGFFYVGVTTRSWQKRWAEHHIKLRLRRHSHPARGRRGGRKVNGRYGAIVDETDSGKPDVRKVRSARKTDLDLNLTNSIRARDISKVAT